MGKSNILRLQLKLLKLRLKFERKNKAQKTTTMQWNEIYNQNVKKEQLGLVRLIMVLEKKSFGIKQIIKKKLASKTNKIVGLKMIF